MLFFLLLLFTVLPLVELVLLLEIGGQVGWPMTILIVLTTGVVGASLARHQGLMTMWRLRTSLGRGEAPTDALLDGALILVAGAVLVTPGVLTDAIGFGLLVPAIRTIVKRGLRAWLARQVRSGGVKVATFGKGPSGFEQGPSGYVTNDQIIDVEVTEVRTKNIDSPDQ